MTELESIIKQAEWKIELANRDLVRQNKQLADLKVCKEVSMADFYRDIEGHVLINVNDNACRAETADNGSQELGNKRLMVIAKPRKNIYLNRKQEEILLDFIKEVYETKDVEIVSKKVSRF